MSDQIRGPTLYGLLNQFEDIGGPEIYGPEGLAIMLALWRKSNKLNWLPSFTMTNTELKVQTGIQTRKTLNVYRKKLVDAGFIRYYAPPLGSSRGEYEINFDLIEPFEVVTSGNNLDEKKSPKAVTSGYNSEKVVTEVVTSGNTVLNEIKDVVVVEDSESRLRGVIRAYCQLHKKMDINVRQKDIGIMQKVIALGVPLPIITETMQQLYRDRNGDISSFGYYEKPILSAWDLEKSITAPVPSDAVPIGFRPQDTGINPKGRASKQSDQADFLKKFVQEQEEDDDPGGSRKAVYGHQLQLPGIQH